MTTRKTTLSIPCRHWAIGAVGLAALVASCEGEVPVSATRPGSQRPPSGAITSGSSTPAASPNVTVSPVSTGTPPPAGTETSPSPTATPGSGIERGSALPTEPPGTPAPTFVPNGSAAPTFSPTPNPTPTPTPFRASWIALEGLPPGLTVRALMAVGDLVYVSGKGAVRMARAPGATGSPLPATTPVPGLPADDVWALGWAGTTGYAGTSSGVYRLPQGGTWAAYNGGLPSPGSGGGYAMSLTATGSTVLAAYGAGVYQSVDGTDWGALGTSFPAGFGTVSSLALGASHVYAGGFAGKVGRVARAGGAWAVFGNTPGSYSNPVTALALSGEYVYAGLRNGAARALAADGSWADFSDGLDGQGVNALLAVGPQLFAGTDAGVMRRDGASWQRFGAGLDTDKVFALAVAGTQLIAGIEGRTGGSAPSVWHLQLP